MLQKKNYEIIYIYIYEYLLKFCIKKRIFIKVVFLKKLQI